MKNKIYKEEYEKFMAAYKVGQVSGEQVGELIARLAQYYGTKNDLLAAHSEILNKKAAEIIQSTDQETGKPMSAAKADILLKATEEHKEYNGVKTDIVNIDQYINALKYLQKGVLNEYSHLSSS